MERIKLIAVLAVAVLLSACGDVHSDINDMLEKNIDVSLVPCSTTPPTKGGLKWGENKHHYVDYEGNPVVDLGYTDVNGIAPFSCGLAYVKGRSGRRFFINKEGETVIDLSTFSDSGGSAYSVFDRFTDDVAFVEVIESVYDVKYYAIDPKGKILFTVDGKPETPMVSGYCLVRNPEGQFVINRKGEVVVDASKESGLRIECLCGSRCDMALAYVDDEYAGILDFASGKFLIPDIPRREIINSHVTGFDWNDRAVVTRDRYQQGLIDRKGNTVVEPIYETLMIDGQWYMANDDDCAIWIDADGKVMLETTYKFRECIGFGTGNLCYVGNGIYIDRKGRVKFECGYEALTPFVNGRAIVRILTGNYFTYFWMDETGAVSELGFLPNSEFVYNIATLPKGIYIEPELGGA